MSVMNIVFDNLGMIVLNYLDCEDLFRTISVKYFKKILNKTKLINSSIKLQEWWKTMCIVEIHEREDIKYDIAYIKYITKGL